MMERELSDEEEDRENLISQNARPNDVVKSPDHRNHRNHRSSFQIDDDFRNRVSGAASKFNKRYIFLIFLPLVILLVYLTTDLKNVFQMRVPSIRDFGGKLPPVTQEVEDLASRDIELEKILAKIGSLPLLHTLVFSGGFFRTREWETVEGQFPSLRILTLIRSPIRALGLELDECGELEKWTMPEDSSSCFPLLEQLCLIGFELLEEIPPEVGEIPTLKSIELLFCSETAVVSAKKILEEKEDLHGEGQGLHVQVKCRSMEAQALQHLATPNFHVSALMKRSYRFPGHTR